jgi:DNA-binding transcriptional ArsR family regulator
VVFRRWRGEARPKLGSWVRDLMVLAPHASYFPDFLTPVTSGGHLEEGLDTVLSTPRSVIREELGVLAEGRRLPAWCSRLAEGDLATLKGVEEGFRTYHRAVVEPHWAEVQAAIAAERSRRSRDLLQRGVGALLNSLGPAIRWRPPVLECDYPVEHDLHLNGRGLLLIPSFFCWRRPVALANPDLQPVLVYPIAHELVAGPGARQSAAHTARSLEALLGRTRAAILSSVEDGCTTTELSRRACTSLASASRHATALREAGLVTTHRHGGGVLHTLTPLGRALLARS